MKNFLRLYEAGSVKRWHTKLTIKDQDLAAHSWGVAMICAHIYPHNAELIQAALTHDLHEHEAGDIPYPFKRGNPAVKEAYAKQEESFAKDHAIAPYLGEELYHALKWADMMELLMWARREINMGNRNLLHTQEVATAALLQMGHPNEAAEYLFSEVLNG